MNITGRLKDFDGMCFPILISSDFLDKNDYKNFKSEFAKIVTCKVGLPLGQEYRKNIVINDQNFQSELKSYPEIYSFFKSLKAPDTLSFLAKNFDDYLTPEWLGTTLKKELSESELELNLAVADSGYENPFHVDTRRRILHGLLYFDIDTYEGGDFEICTLRDDVAIKPQIPHKSQIKEIKAFKTSANFGAIVLSNPSSFHRGTKTYGKRYFVYFSYNSRNVIWTRTRDWEMPMDFKRGLKYQKMKSFLLAKIYQYLTKNVSFLVAKIASFKKKFNLAKSRTSLTGF